LSKLANNGNERMNVAVLNIRATHFIINSLDLLIRRRKRAPTTGRNIIVLRIG
jgi:hypothetical protein